MSRLVLLEPAAGFSVPAALSRALAGGPPVAPLPLESTERARACVPLRPSVPVSEPDAVAIVSTSGSTGVPKGVVLSRSAVRASADATHARLGGPGDWALVLPVHYVAGLMVVARTLVAGTRLHHGAADLSDLTALVEAMGRPRYLSLVPTQLVRGLAHHPTAEALAQFDTVLLGGAAAEPGLLARAKAAGVRVVTTYGMSETCGGCVYDQIPLDPTTVDLAPGSERIRIGGATLFSGYRLRPDLTADALVPAEAPGPAGAPVPSQGIVPLTAVDTEPTDTEPPDTEAGTQATSTARQRVLLTADRGRWSNGQLEVLGRVDDVVVSGGMNVDLAAVERAARGWSDSGELAVLGVADPEWGVRVVAVSDTSDDLAGLRAYLAHQLPAYVAPRTLIRLAVLPRTSSGKIDRRHLLRTFTDLDPARSDRRPDPPPPPQPGEDTA